MKRQYTVVLSLLGGVATGGFAVQALHAQTKPPGILVAEHEVHDPQTMGAYAAAVPATLQPFGGRFLVLPGKVTTLQGEPPKGPFVVLAFDSVERAQAWLDSPAYQAIKPMRLKAANSRVFLVEGAPN